MDGSVGLLFRPRERFVSSLETGHRGSREGDGCLGAAIPAAFALGMIKVIILQRCLSPSSKKGEAGEEMVHVQRDNEDRAGEVIGVINVHVP